MDLVDNGEYNLWWENVLYTMTDKHPVYVQNVDGKFWAEVDYIEDYERIKKGIEGKSFIYRHKSVYFFDIYMYKKRI